MGGVFVLLNGDPDFVFGEAVFADEDIEFPGFQEEAAVLQVEAQVGLAKGEGDGLLLPGFQGELFVPSERTKGPDTASEEVPHVELRNRDPGSVPHVFHLHRKVKALSSFQVGGRNHGFGGDLRNFKFGVGKAVAEGIVGGSRGIAVVGQGGHHIPIVAVDLPGTRQGIVVKGKLTLVPGQGEGQSALRLGIPGKDGAMASAARVPP